MSARRRFVIKPSTAPARLDKDAVDSTYGKISDAVKIILSGGSSEKLSFEQLYR
jgi:hypothetical protein